MGIRFWPKLTHFLSNQAEIFYGNSGDYYLLGFLPFFWKKLYLAGKGSGASGPDQKVDPQGGPFGSTVILKNSFQKFRAWTPHPQVSCPCVSMRFLAITQKFWDQFRSEFAWIIRRLLFIDCAWEIQGIIVTFWAILAVNGRGNHIYV